MSLHPPMPGRQDRKPTILVVDDDPRVIELLEIALDAHGFRVIRAGDGEEAMQVAANERPDLVVLDVRLPRRSGLEVCEALRRDPDDPGVPIILVSAAAETEARVLGLARGADDYLVKPFSPKELLARIKRLLVRSRESREARRLGIEAELELARAREEAQRHHVELRHARRVRELADMVARDLHRRSDLDDLSRTFLVAVRRHLHVNVAALFTASEHAEVFEPVAVLGAGPERLLGAALRRDGDLARLLDGLGRAVRVLELERFTELRGELPMLVASGVTVLAPVHGAGGLEAVLAFDDRVDGAALGRFELDLLAAMLESFAIALAHAQRAEAQGETMLRLLHLIADESSPDALTARADAERLVDGAGRLMLLSRRERMMIGTAVRLQGIDEPRMDGLLRQVVDRDDSGALTRLVTLLDGVGDSETAGELNHVLVRAGRRFATLRGTGCDARAALERTVADLRPEATLEHALRRALEPILPGERTAA